MRVLISVAPEKSTFLYAVPLIWALRTAGHEVHVASQSGFADTITQAGLTAVPVGRDVPSKWTKLREDPELLESIRVGIPEPWDVAEFPERANWERLLEGHQSVVYQSHKPDNFPMISGLVDYARYWQPDLVLWEPLSYAGPIAAKACGAAHARLLWSVDVFGVTRQTFVRLRDQQPEGRRADPLADWLGSYARKYGGEYTEDMAVGHFTIDQFPRGLQIEAEGLHYIRTQYIPYGGPAVIPDWLREPPKRPRVALTLGLTATEVFNAYNIPLSEILDSLGDLDIELVATIAEAEQRKLTHIPENARLVSYVPWHALVPTCDAVINHAGAATLATTARQPIPQLTLPFHFDQPVLGRKLAEHGAGLNIPSTQATGHNIREALQRLLNEPRFRHRATDLRDEIHSTPTPNELVPQLEQLTTKHRPR